MQDNHLYNIVLQNNTGSRQQYVFLCDPPATSGPDMQALAWINATVANNGTYTVSTTDQVFAWTGTCQDSGLRPGMVVKNGCITPVQMGTDHMPGTTAHMTVDCAVPEFSASTMGASEGCFKIDTDDSFSSNQDEYLIGMAKVGAHGMVCPVAACRAMPNRTTSMAPRMRFMVCQMMCQTGEVVNTQSMTQKCMVDFTCGKGRFCNTAVVQQDESGQCMVTYYSQMEAAEVMQAVRDGQLRSHVQKRAGSNDDSMRELTRLTSAMNRLLSSMDLSINETEMSMRWIGRVNWPAAISISTAAAGATMISRCLTERGYGVKYRTTTNSDGTKMAEFTLSRSSSSNGSNMSMMNMNMNMNMNMMMDPESDWLAALKTNTQDDGATNGGFNPAPGMDRAALSRAQKRVNLQQFRDSVHGCLGQQQMQRMPTNDYGVEMNMNRENGMQGMDMMSNNMDMMKGMNGMKGMGMMNDMEMNNMKGMGMMNGMKGMDMMGMNGMKDMGMMNGMKGMNGTKGMGMMNGMKGMDMMGMNGMNDMTMKNMGNSMAMNGMHMNGMSGMTNGHMTEKSNGVY